MQEKYEKLKKYTSCMPKDVESGVCKAQFFGAFGTETTIYIDDEREVDGNLYYLLRIEKPDNESKMTWKAADEVDGRLKPFVEVEKPKRK